MGMNMKIGFEFGTSERLGIRLGLRSALGPSYVQTFG